MPNTTWVSVEGYCVFGNLRTPNCSIAKPAITFLSCPMDFALLEFGLNAKRVIIACGQTSAEMPLDVFNCTDGCLHLKLCIV